MNEVTEDFLTSRGITRVSHFTHLSNFEGILEHGLIPRSDLKVRSLPSRFFDKERRDGWTTHNCFSISWPNPYLLKSRHEADPEFWVILWLDAKEILLHPHSRFF